MQKDIQITSDNSTHVPLLRFILDHLNIGIFVMDTDFRMTLWNKFMVSHCGLSEQDVLGKEIFDIFPELPKQWFRKKVMSVFMLKSYAFSSWQQRNYLFQFKHNRPATGGVEHMFQNVSLIPVKSSTGDVDQVVVVIQDATDEGISATKLQATMQSLETMSRTDGLTGLFNRAYWELQLQKEFERFQRYGTHCSLMMVDIDHFKSVNDQYGHLAGDQVIQMVSHIIQDDLRAVDIAGRYGGEEFGILLPETEIDEAVVVAEKIRKKVQKATIDSTKGEISITCSVGIAETKRANSESSSAESELETYDAFIDLADEALYASKTAGRNCTTRADGLPVS